MSGRNHIDREVRQAASPRDWIHREPGLEAARETLIYLRPRVRARWLTTLLTALLLTGLVVLWRSRVPPRFDASIVVRVTEKTFDETTKPPSSGELTSFINEVFLTRSTLLAIIEEHGLYPDKMGPDPGLALEAMRDDLDLRVVQNYFAPERFMDDPVRSARIVVSYVGRTPDQALAVVRAIGERISAEQTRIRKQSAQWAAAQARMAEKALAAQLSSVRSRQARLNASAVSPASLVELARLLEQAQHLEAELDLMRDQSGSLELRGALEESRMGMRFELVDTGRRPTALMSRRAQLGLIGAFAFAVLLPLSALGVGTLGTRIRSGYGVQRLGMTTLGTLPWPPAWMQERRNP